MVMTWAMKIHKTKKQQTCGTVRKSQGGQNWAAEGEIAKEVGVFDMKDDDER